MRPTPLISRCLCRCALFGAAVVSQAGLLYGQDAGKLSPPPDFSQPATAAAAQEVVATWTRWMRVGRESEQDVLRQPMGEARQSLQRRLGDFQDFLDSRRAYSEAVVAYLERSRVEPRPGQSVVTLAELCQDHVYELGMHLTALRAKLSALREFPEWTSVRRSVQPESDMAFKLQSERMSEMPVELSLVDSRPAEAVSLLVYRNLEREFMDQLGRLWTRYYQALADAVEQGPGGAAPLIPVRSSVGAAGSPVPAVVVPNSAPPAQSSGNPLVGVWTYPERSQKFNGVAEPRNVLLELWIENGVLMGRYRAELPDFQTDRKVDLRLHGAIAPAGAPQALYFELKDPVATGQIVLEGPGTGGLEIVVERRVPAGSPIPRGRELLKRR